MRKRVVLTFCGVDWVEDNREVPATFSVRITLNESHAFDLDLCAEHASSYPLQRLVEDVEGESFLAHYGTLAEGEIFGLRPAVTGAIGTYGMFTCPICGEERRGRTGAIGHMIAIHKTDRVDASHRLPPTGESIECEVCGFLAQLGQGYGAHVRSEHGEKQWEKIKKTLPAKR